MDFGENVAVTQHDERPEAAEWQLPDEAATGTWGAALARALDPELLCKQAFAVHLSGDLGAGKTALVRAVLRAAGFGGPVKSPTFALLEPYNLAKFSAYHFDLYRFSSSEQWFDAGFDDVLAAPGLVLVEWPEKAADALGTPDLRILLAPTRRDGERRLRACAFGEAGCQCLNRLRTDQAITAWSMAASATGSGSTSLPSPAPSPAPSPKR